MKKTICLTLVIMAVMCCLTACNFTLNSIKDNAESTPKVKEMLTALTNGNLSDAKALLHPQLTNAPDDSINQMIGYFNGRSVSSIDLINVNYKSSVGTSGQIMQEQATYRITLNFTETVYITSVYLSNNEGFGFISFQLVMGLV